MCSIQSTPLGQLDHHVKAPLRSVYKQTACGAECSHFPSDTRVTLIYLCVSSRQSWKQGKALNAWTKDQNGAAGTPRTPAHRTRPRICPHYWGSGQKKIYSWRQQHSVPTNFNVTLLQPYNTAHKQFVELFWNCYYIYLFTVLGMYVRSQDTAREVALSFTVQGVAASTFSWWASCWPINKFFRSKC